MPKQYSHADAARLAGEVFGKVLDREADPAGYDYVLDCLEGGKKTLRQIARDGRGEYTKIRKQDM